MADPTQDDDDSTHGGPISYALNYKITGTPFRVWHLLVIALVAGFALGKFI